MTCLRCCGIFNGRSIAIKFSAEYLVMNHGSNVVISRCCNTYLVFV